MLEMVVFQRGIINNELRITNSRYTTKWVDESPHSYSSVLEDPS